MPQVTLPETITAARADELQQRIASAETALGQRLLILGHHYP